MSEVQFNQFTKPIAFWNRSNFATQQVSTANVLPDTFESSNVKPKKLSKTAKWCIALGSTAVVIGGAIIGIRANYAKVAQKTFQNIFMRDDITKKEALEIIKRYKEIEKIQDKEKYVKALFEEVKRNYGLGKTDIKLTMLENNLQGKSVATSDCLNRAINMPLSLERKSMFATMHHEFRHAKQNDLMYSLSPIETMRKVFGEPSEEAIKVLTKQCEDAINQGLFKSIDDLTEGLCVSDFILSQKARQYRSNFTCSELTPKQKKLAEKLLKSERIAPPDLNQRNNFFKFIKDAFKHLTSTKELDAYKAGFGMDWLFKFMPSNLS